MERRRAWDATYPPPFPNGKGARCVMGLLNFQSNVSLEEGFGFSPLGETGDGRGVLLFCITIPPCRSRTSSQVKPSPKKNFNATPLSFEHLPIFKNENGESRRDMTPAEKTAKRLARTACE